MIGFIFPFIAKVEEICINRIYEKLNESPIPICNPMPPFALRDATETPINVKINVENGNARRLYFSIR